MHPTWFIKDFSSVLHLATFGKLGIFLLGVLVSFALMTLLAKRITLPSSSLPPAADDDELLAAAVAAARHLHENNS
jgi:hypothetical protein